MAEKEIYNERYRELFASFKDVRKNLGMTQAEVAGKTGRGRTWVAKIECCELRLDVLHLVKLCRVYKLKARDVVGRME